jgi:hypothetical protein
MDSIAATVLELNGRTSVDSSTVGAVYRWLFGAEAAFVVDTEIRVEASLRILENPDLRDVHVPHPGGSLGCGSREWYRWTNGSTLTIDLATWGCVPLGNRHDAGAEATYALLGVPLSRLPNGRLLVEVVDSGVLPVPVTVP